MSRVSAAAAGERQMPGAQALLRGRLDEFAARSPAIPPPLAPAPACVEGIDERAMMRCRHGRIYTYRDAWMGRRRLVAALLPHLSLSVSRLTKAR